MPKFHVVEGSFVVTLPKEPGADKDAKPKQQTIGLGGEVELTNEARRALDPRGEMLVTPEVFAELKKIADAHVALSSKLSKPLANVAVNHKLIAALAALPAPKKDTKP